MGWSRAYNFNLDRRVTITEAMQLRNREDPRAGDLHCHKECYLDKKGSQLLTRKESIDEKTGEIRKRACFAKWPQKYDSSDLYCGINSKAKSRRESMDYAEYFKSMEEYLLRLELDHEPYFVKQIDILNEDEDFDFTIVHSNSTETGIQKSKIVIVDENKRRLKLFKQSTINDDEFNIVIRISEFTPEQLVDFQRSGIEKLLLEWNYLQSLFLMENNPEFSSELIPEPLNEKLNASHDDIESRKLDYYILRISGPWISLEGSIHTVRYRYPQLEEGPIRSKRYRGQNLSDYLNHYKVQNNLSNGMFPLASSHVKNNSVCSYCHDEKVEHKRCYFCYNGYKSITCSLENSLDEIIDLINKFGIKSKCIDCGDELCKHLNPKEHLSNSRDRGMESSDVYKLLKLLEDGDKISLEGLRSITCFDLNKIAKDLSKSDDYATGYVRLNDLIVVRKPERYYDPNCKRCNLGVIRRRCICDEDGDIITGMVVTCNDKIGQLREGWEELDFIFQGEGRHINLICKHCELVLDQFETFVDKIPSVDWTIERMFESKFLDLPAELTDLELLLLNEIKLPDIRDAFNSDRY